MKHRKSVYTTFTLISQLGISIVVPVFLCTFVGMKIDERFHTSFTIPMILIGVLSGIRNAYVMIRQATKVMESEKSGNGYWELRKSLGQQERIDEQDFDEEGLDDEEE